jgi:glycosyltransferase involved in cell wall biosynthesis
MKILYDHQAFALQSHGGVSRCFAELYKHFPKDIEAEIALEESSNVYMNELGIGKPFGYWLDHFILPFQWPLKKKMFVAYNLMRGKGEGYYWNQSKYNKEFTVKRLPKGGFDVFHPTYFDDYFLPYLNGKPFVLTIHDMIPELYPQYYQRDDGQITMKEKLVPLASAIIAVSENTKRDIIRLLNVPEEKVHVVYHGCSFPTKSDFAVPYHQPYLLYVGERGNYKNFLPFVYHLIPVFNKHPELKVVCTGKPFTEFETQFLKECGVNNRFINHWVATDEEFFALYHQALCFVYPSEYEGFGIPILEAYAADCPVMLNNASCFPEIAGDAALYFDMKMEQSNLAEKMEEMLSMNHEEREEMLAKQRKRLSRYSWDESAKKLAEIYRQVAKMSTIA